MNLHVGRTTFQQNTVGQQEKTSTAAHPELCGGFVKVHVDFIEVPNCCHFEYFLLGLEMFSGWVEPSSSQHVDATAIAKSG